MATCTTGNVQQGGRERDKRRREKGKKEIQVKGSSTTCNTPKGKGAEKVFLQKKIKEQEIQRKISLIRNMYIILQNQYPAQLEINLTLV